MDGGECYSTDGLRGSFEMSLGYVTKSFDKNIWVRMPIIHTTVTTTNGTPMLRLTMPTAPVSKVMPKIIETDFAAL